jgi:hypothetical protein
MKVLKLMILSLALIATSASFLACGGDNTADNKTGKEYTSAYICPMHCEGSGSDEEGKCPECGMDYVVNEDYKSEEGDHEGHDHDGHNH